MAYKALLIAFFVLFSTSLARQQHQHQQQRQNVCQLRNIEALEPVYTVQAEAGVTEIWDNNNQQFQCAGVDFVRHRIQAGGLFLPSYVNAPLLVFVERGSGVQGVILPGCPETYEYTPEQQYSRERRQQSFQDRHQKVENLKQGDVLAVPAGAAHWLYNDGSDELVVVVFFDTQNAANQLDQNQRRFFLAGNPYAQGQQQQQQGQQGKGRFPIGGRDQPRTQGQGQHPRAQGQQQQGQQGQERFPIRGRDQPRTQGQGQHPSRGQEQSDQETGNIFNGFDAEILAEVFNVDRETAESLQGQRDQRGHIVNVGQDLKIISPQQQHQQQQSRARPQQQQPGQQQGGRGGSGHSNGLEETICSLKLKENIDNPTQADFVNPQAGRLTNLNNLKFPILQLLQLSAERGELYPNAIHAPHWTLNAHTLIYITHGNMRLQIVNNEGNSVFDNDLQEGQVVVIPQNFATIRRAGEQGCRWISFRTNDNAITANLAGRLSAIRSMPVDVVANAYQLSLDEAQRLKNSQEQAVLLSPSYSRSQGRASA